MRTLLISFEYPPKCGGAGRVAEELLGFLNQNGIITDLLTAGKAGSVSKGKAKIFYARYIPVLFPVAFKIALKAVRAERYHTIILNDIGAALAACMFMDDKTKKRCILYLHGAEPEHIIDHPKFLFRLVSFRKKYIWMLKNCKAVISVSQYMKEYMLRSVQGLGGQKIHVVHNAVSRHQFYYDPKPVRKKYKIQDTAEIIFTAGRIEIGKGHDELYLAVKELLEEGFQIVWFIAGEGSFADVLKTNVKKDGLEDHIRFIGNVNQNVLRIFYSSSDVFVQLSRYEEAFGLVYLEAIMCGCPVIAYDKGAIKEVVRNGINGFLIKNMSECMDILKNKSYKKFKRQTITDSVFDYTSERCELMEIIRNDR